jgi:hypothetical protein
MRSRCNTVTCPDYKDYGAKGVKVCARWDSFENFLKDMGERPQGMTIERNDNTRGYEPDNCRWATRAEQTYNRAATKRITIDGVTKSQSQWARDYGIHPAVFAMRLIMGWDLQRALTSPVVSSGVDRIKTRQRNEQGQFV